MAMSRKELIFRGPPEEVADIVTSLFEDLVTQLGSVTPAAVLGMEPETHLFVLAYDELLGRVLKTAAEVEPDLVLKRGDEYVFIDAKGSPSELAIEVLEQSALHAPFSPWVAKFGSGTGTALFLISEVRRYLKGVGPLELPPEWAVFPHVVVDRDDYARFARRVWLELTRLRSEPLIQIATSFQLTKTEAAKLFGVRRQALDTWEEKGIPTSRREKIATIDALRELLEKKLKPDRIPAVVRRRAGAYDGHTILEMIAMDRQSEVLDDIRKRFDWAATA